GTDNNPGSSEKAGFITGSVFDSATNKPVSYANVVLYSLPDSVMITAAVTDAGGAFQLSGLSYGSYFIKIHFFGYKKMTTQKFEISSAKKKADLGAYIISPSAFAINGAEVTGERSIVEYKIDKQVINADKVINASNGNAIDVLRNSPSVNVDNDDNITLRGSGAFILMIDGKPTIMDAKEALKQIPASQVENIEIITNPSAKYSAEGASGIINVIRKKTRNESFGALFSVKAGLRDKYSSDLSFGWNRKKWNTNVSVNWNDERYFPSSKYTRIFQYGDSSSTLNSYTKRPRHTTNKSARFNAEFNPNDHNSFSLGLEGGQYLYLDNMQTNYEEMNSEGSAFYTYSDFLMNISGNYANANFTYKHVFDTSAHSLTFTFVDMAMAGSTILQNQLYLSDENQTTLNPLYKFKSDEANSLQDINVSLDYTDVWRNGLKIETGYNYYYRPFDGNFRVSVMDPVSLDWVSSPSQSTLEVFDQSKHSVYLTLGGKWKDFEYQGGFRTEYYDRIFDLTSLSKSYTMEGLYGFPSFSLLRSFKNNSQLQLSYSRRVQYPDDWSLSPVTFYNDGYINQAGNPNLKPEFIGMTELNFSLPFKKHMLSLSAYNRRNHDAIVRTYLPEGETVVLGVGNVGQVFYTGIESGLNMVFSKKVSMNFSANVFRKESKGESLGIDLSFVEMSYSGRLMLNYTPFKNTRIQLNSSYNGPERDGQGVREAMVMAGISLKQDFYQKKFSATINVRNVIPDFKYHINVKEANFVSNMDFSPEFPVIMFGLTYKINNYKARQSQGGGGNGIGPIG
ncbi:MAG: TonB-dependent receptor, partial [Bacteroidota bacterium]